MALGKKILELRKERGWNQKKTASLLGTSATILGRYEQEKITPSVTVAKKMADTFNVTLDYLVDDNGKMGVFHDKTMLQRWEAIENLSNEDRGKLLAVIDAFLRDASTKQAYLSSSNNHSK